MMKARWEVEDGYVGKSRPQTTEIDDDAFMDAETEDELMQNVEAYVRDDFDNQISWAFSNWDELVEYWRETKKPSVEG